MPHLSELTDEGQGVSTESHTQMVDKKTGIIIVFILPRYALTFISIIMHIREATCKVSIHGCII